MIDLIKNMFITPKAGTREVLSRHDVHIACCALLLEMASIDGEFSEVEKEHIITILKNEYSISDEEAQSLIQTAGEEIKCSIDYWHFTNIINQNCSEEEKIRITETIWKVIYADGKMDGHEDYLVHNLAKCLRLSHKQLIDAKLKAKASM